jgi:prefoldin subunit 5
METPNPAEPPAPTLNQLLEKSRQLREQSDHLNAEMKTLEEMIARAARENQATLTSRDAARSN